MSKISSDYKSQKYEVVDTMRILNPKQAAFYWDKGIVPLDIYLSHNFETKEPIIVYVFSRSESKTAYEEWCANGKNIKNTEE